MHIALLIPTLDRIGGAEQQVILLARSLVRRGWRVSVIALSGTGGDAAVDLQSNGIAFVSLHMRKGLADPRGWIQLHHWIKRNHPDALHSHLPHAVLIARWSRWLAPFRILVETIHSPATGGPLRRFAYRISARQPDAVTAVSHAAAEPWPARRMVQEAQLAIIPNGIDLDHWKLDPKIRRAMRQKLGLGNEFAWLSIGRLDPVKDHATLLRAFARLSSGARLLVAGAGPLESKLRQLTATLGLESRVQFLGFQRDVLPWMQAADAFVLTSRWEGLPVAFLEASSCQLPAVCTDIPAIRELVSDVSGHTLVPVGDSVALAGAMNAMMALPEPDRCALGQQMRHSVATRFSLPSVVDQWEEIYRALLALKPQPTRSGIAPSTSLRSTLQLQ